MEPSGAVSVSTIGQTAENPAKISLFFEVGAGSRV
jgi:hypothetical protein